MSYVIQTRLRDRWAQIHPMKYDTLQDATFGLEHLIDTLFFECKAVTTAGDFRIVNQKYLSNALSSRPVQNDDRPSRPATSSRQSDTQVVGISDPTGMFGI